jgi:hypothetical protein
MTTRPYAGALIAALIVTTAAASFAADPSQVCRSDKNKAAGKLARCRYEAHARYMLTHNATRRAADLARCETRFGVSWQSAEAKAEAEDWSCPKTGDEADTRDFVAHYTDHVSDALGGAPLENEPHAWRLRTGVTDCWNAAGQQIPCAGTGQDGELQTGLSPFYLDLGETILDTRTGLMWEKHTDDGSIHDMDEQYTWSGAFDKVETLNAIRFAGYDDWRVPNANELYSVVDLGTEFPATSIAFNWGCVPGCSYLTCSCWDHEFGHGTTWSSTTLTPYPGFAVILWGSSGHLHLARAGATLNVRAVRGGI